MPVFSTHENDMKRNCGPIPPLAVHDRLREFRLDIGHDLGKCRLAKRIMPEEFIGVGDDQYISATRVNPFRQIGQAFFKSIEVLSKIARELQCGGSLVVQSGEGTHFMTA